MAWLPGGYPLTGPGGAELGLGARGAAGGPLLDRVARPPGAGPQCETSLQHLVQVVALELQPFDQGRLGGLLQKAPDASAGQPAPKSKATVVRNVGRGRAPKGRSWRKANTNWGAPTKGEGPATAVRWQEPGGGAEKAEGPGRRPANAQGRRWRPAGLAPGTRRTPGGTKAGGREGQR